MSKILLVDDDAFVVEVYSRKLLEAGFEVRSAPDGDAALEVLQSARPDVVVLDLMLPRFNGFELLNYLRSRPDFKATRTIVLSNFYLGSSERDAAAAQADVTLAKSHCTPAVLLESVNQLLLGGKVPPAPAPATKTAVDKETDAGIQERHRSEFLKNAPTTLATLRQLNDAFVHSPTPRIRALRLATLYQKVHFLTSVAGLTGCEPIAMLASAFESLLHELHNKPELITACNLQTIAYTLDFFSLLFAQAGRAGSVSGTSGKALVVDDDRVTSQALVNALRRAKLDAAAAHQPLLALKLLEQEDYALILLDIQMPDLDGFEFCEKVRQRPRYRRTPVIFVTAQHDFESRIQSVLSGGNDLIAKPVLPIELVLKAVTHLLRSRLPAEWSLP